MKQASKYRFLYIFNWKFFFMDKMKFSSKKDHCIHKKFIYRQRGDKNWMEFSQPRVFLQLQFDWAREERLWNFNVF